MSITISRILHAGYVLQCAGTCIAFDTIYENPFSKNCHAFPPIQFDYEKMKQLNFSAVFISHFHDDHCSLESLNYLGGGWCGRLYQASAVDATGLARCNSLKQKCGAWSCWPAPR